jgi:hypothetical protein
MRTFTGDDISTLKDRFNSCGQAWCLLHLFALADLQAYLRYPGLKCAEVHIPTIMYVVGRADRGALTPRAWASHQVQPPEIAYARLTCTIEC